MLERRRKGLILCLSNGVAFFCLGFYLLAYYLFIFTFVFVIRVWHVNSPSFFYVDWNLGNLLSLFNLQLFVICRLFFNFTCKPTLPQTVHLLHVFQHNPENQAQGKGDAHCKNTNSFSTTIITSCR